MMRRLPWPVFVLCVAATSCAEDGTPNVLDPRGPEADRVARISILLFVAAAVISVIVIVAVLAAGLGWLPRPRWSHDRWVGVWGAVVPGIVLIGVAAVSIAATTDLRPADSASGALRIEVTGHQFWWEVRYPELGIVTANEMHIPVERDIELVLRSADVIHSFWVPQLAGKLDTIPGQTNRLRVRADETGSYWAPCAEFCGLQHANMAIVVVASDPADFDRWAADRARSTTTSSSPPRPSGDTTVARGREVFDGLPCAGCHRVADTEFQGEVGPDLTDVGSRRYLGAGVIENTPDNLAAWVRNAPSIKPGVRMPPFDIDEDDLTALVTYLESLRG